MTPQLMNIADYYNEELLLMDLIKLVLPGWTLEVKHSEGNLIWRLVSPEGEDKGHILEIYEPIMRLDGLPRPTKEITLAIHQQTLIEAVNIRIKYNKPVEKPIKL